MSRLPGIRRRSRDAIFIPIATKLILTHLLIIAFISAVFVIVGIQLISDRFVSEAQVKVRNDLNAAREIYLGNLAHVNDVIRLTASRFFLRDALISGDMSLAADELTRTRDVEGLDILSITDKYGYVVLRTSNIDLIGDMQGNDELVQSVLLNNEPVASSVIVAGEDLLKESPHLAEQAYIKFIDTPLARQRIETEETSGMMLKAAAPVTDDRGKLVGVVYGGILLNRNYDIVDKIKQTVYQDIKYEGQDIGTATIFQDDVRVTTNVRNEDGSRAIGTRVSDEVYDQVVIGDEPWIGRAYVVNNWYITAYEPITDLYDRTIGILYVGLLEKKYVDIQRNTILIFLAVTLAGALVSLVASHFISKRISVPIGKLVSASKEIAGGHLDARVVVKTNDELEYLGDSFNAMAMSIKKRDEQLKDYATQKIMESERLAMIGQLAANVAHELNNPLQGIVAYSHLLLEQMPNEQPTREYAIKIVGQADRSRDIIRGLLDFSRQRKPDKIECNINNIVQESISLVENQALFHNIDIIRNFEEDLPVIVVDPSQIERVFINIIVNAAEAMDGNGELRLTTRHDPRTKFVAVEIADTGCGIDEEDLNKVFDPFFTTKDVGHGTGLGLAISYGIVKRHRGTITVESEVGEGTSFTIYLPIKVAEKVSPNGR
jgi:two-component system NtrC family sensor kinase